MAIVFNDWKRVNKYRLKNSLGYQITATKIAGIWKFIAWAPGPSPPPDIKYNCKDAEEAKAACRKHYDENQ